MVTFLIGLAHAESFTIELIDANPKMGFHFPYVLRMPGQLRNADIALLVETNNTGNNDNFIDTKGNAIIEEPYNYDADATIQFQDLGFLNELIKSLTFMIFSWLFAWPNGPQ